MLVAIYADPRTTRLDWMFNDEPKPPLNLSFILSGGMSAGPREPPGSVAGEPTRPPAVAIQFLKFGIVGISNTLLTFVVYTILLKGFGVWYLAASAIGFAVGATNGFLLNRRWTFREHVGDALTPVRWGIVQTTGLAINEGLLFVFVNEAHIDKLLAQAMATVVVTITTFIANRSWTFRMHHHEHPVAAADGEA